MKKLLLVYQYTNSFGRLVTESIIESWNPTPDADEILFFNWLQRKTPTGSNILNIIDLTTLCKQPVPVQPVAPPVEFLDGMDSVPSIVKPKRPGRGERI